MKKFLLIALLCFPAAVASAEVITLQSGKTVEGEIIEQTDEYIKVKTEDGPVVINRRLIDGSKRPQRYLSPAAPGAVEEKLRQARQKEVSRVAPAAADTTKAEPKKEAEQAKQGPKKYSGPPVEVYVTPRDPKSQMLEEFLKSHNIPYERYDVETSLLNRKRLEKLGGSYPLVKIGNEVIDGLNTDRILELVNK